MYTFTYTFLIYMYARTQKDKEKKRKIQCEISGAQNACNVGVPTAFQIKGLIEREDRRIDGQIGLQGKT